MLPLRDLLVLSLVVGSIPICFLRPFYGVALWTFLSFANPHRYSWGPAQEFPVAMAVAIPTLAGFLVFSRSWKNLLSREVMWIVLLWAWFTVTTMVSTHTSLFVNHAEDTWNRWEFVSKIMLMTVVSIGVIDSWKKFRWFLLVIAGSFGFLVLKALPWMIATEGTVRFSGPPGTMVADNNDFGLAMNMTLPIFFFLAKAEADPKMRRLFGFLFAISIIAIFFTYSRGAMVGLCALFLLLLIHVRRKAILFLVLLLAVCAAFFLTTGDWRERMDPTKPELIDESAQGRLDAWTFAWRLSQDSPLTGGGFETFTTELFQRYLPERPYARSAHSIYFGVLGEHGFIGLILYLGLIGSLLLSLRRLIRYSRDSGNELVLSYSTMLWLGLAAFLVSGAFLGRQYFDYFFTLAACTSLLRQGANYGWMPQTSTSPEEEWPELGRERVVEAS